MRTPFAEPNLLTRLQVLRPSICPPCTFCEIHPSDLAMMAIFIYQSSEKCTLHLFDLPAELRLLVFQYILSVRGVLTWRAECTLYTVKPQTARRRPTETYHPFWPLFVANRRLHEECSSMLLQQNTILFKSRSRLISFLNGSARQSQTVRSVIYHLPCTDAGTSGSLSRDDCFELLQFRYLRCLELHSERPTPFVLRNVEAFASLLTGDSRAMGKFLAASPSPLSDLRRLSLCKAEGSEKALRWYNHRYRGGGAEVTTEALLEFNERLRRNFESPR